MDGYETKTASQALERLRAGNLQYQKGLHTIGDTSPEIRRHTARRGQKPYAVVIACSDSRVIPEAIFDAGVGELFVIRVAGNVIDHHQLGSIEYAASHLGAKLIVVLGHTLCGAVDAAMNHDPSGYIRFITDEIKKAIGEERDEVRACCLNVAHSVERIESSLEIQSLEQEGMQVVGMLYHLEDGRVEVLPRW